jgi:hypothetical protein
MNQLFAFILPLAVLASPALAQSASTSENPRDLVGKTCYAGATTGGRSPKSSTGQKWVITQGKDGNDLSLEFSRAFGREAYEDPKKAAGSMDYMGPATDLKVSGNSFSFTAPTKTRYIMFMVRGRLSGSTQPTQAGFSPADVNGTCE